MIVGATTVLVTVISIIVLLKILEERYGKRRYNKEIKRS